jgi:hypothetical protein
MARQYKNKGGNSSVRSTQASQDKIKVKFSDNSTYVYSKESAGTRRVNTMKKLAEEGQGLNSYINRRAYELYESKDRPE